MFELHFLIIQKARSMKDIKVKFIVRRVFVVVGYIDIGHMQQFLKARLREPLTCSYFR